MEGFSGIIKVYAAVNSKRDRVPFVPIMIRGAEYYWHWQKSKTKVHKTRDIILDIYKPLYLPREWLKPIEEGGKTPREMVNWLMMFLARKKGQEKLYPNGALERRRKSNDRQWH